jgi:predicted 2-oxoglutarate/Fe(II)-dependent dioxygenase YbiX
MTLIIRPFKKHEELKQTFLELIDSLPPSKQEKTISNTDWYLPKEHKREYVNLFHNNIEEHMNFVCKQLKCQTWEIQNIWFQQYKEGDEHDWHNHPHTQFSNVYFLELPSTNMKTEFATHPDINVSEGDVITFPAHLVHRSKPNQSNKRKTIISFNSSFIYGKKII